MKTPEAEVFADIAERLGVPRDRMIVENRSTNTGENVPFTRQLLAERGLDLRRFILVQKPYMERRTFATFKKVWPEPAIVVTSPQVTMDEYLRAYSNDFALAGRRGEHHGRRPAAHSRLCGARVSDSAGDSGRRVERV